MKPISEGRGAEEIRLHRLWGCIPAGPAVLDSGLT